MLTNGWEAQFWGWVGEEEECWGRDKKDGGCSVGDGEERKRNVGTGRMGDWRNSGTGRMRGVAEGMGSRGGGMLGQRQGGRRIEFRDGKERDVGTGRKCDVVHWDVDDWRNAGRMGDVAQGMGRIGV